jgi:hypothetical protein
VQIAAFALPFSGAARIFSFTDPSSSTPTISFLELFGITFHVQIQRAVSRSRAARSSTVTA